MFFERHIEPEFLDHAPPEDARRNLADIVRLNQRFGGHAIIGKLLASVVGDRRRFTLLDVGAASGDTARLVTQLYPDARITSLDLNAVNLRDAPQPKLLADAFQLPFKPESFDFVFCSLFLHHFENCQVSALLAHFYALARRALLISDLERHVLPYFFLPLTQPFLKWRGITVHDGMISVRAGFRACELRHLSEAAGIPNPEVLTHRPAFRLSLVATKVTPKGTDTF